MHAADEISLEHSVRVSTLAKGIATPCSARVLRPLTVTFSPSPEFETSAVVEALQCIPPVDADIFEEPADDDGVFFEEPVDDIVRRLALLTHMWARRMSAIAAVLAVLIWLLLLSLLCASFPCVCFTLFAFPLAVIGLNY